MFDFHMHTTVSYDGHNTAEEMAAAAAAAGLKEICFTDHLDYDPLGLDPNMTFATEEYNVAYDGLNVPGLKIRQGFEFGMLPDNQATFKEDVQRRHFDFVLGSVHFVDGLDIYLPPYWQTRTVEEAEQSFLEHTLECVSNHDEFDVLAHLTYISKTRAHPTHSPLDMKKYQALVDQILRTLAQTGKGLEVNTSGIDRCGCFLPEAAFLQRFKELGGKIVTVGSDAHTADRVGQYCQDACRMLKDIFGYVCTFADRTPIFHNL